VFLFVPNLEVVLEVVSPLFSAILFFFLLSTMLALLSQCHLAPPRMKLVYSSLSVDFFGSSLQLYSSHLASVQNDHSITDCCDSSYQKNSFLLSGKMTEKMVDSEQHLCLTFSERSSCADQVP
jgi:hypothetical protein